MRDEEDGPFGGVRAFVDPSSVVSAQHAVNRMLWSGFNEKVLGGWDMRCRVIRRFAVNPTVSFFAVMPWIDRLIQLADQYGAKAVL